MKKLFDELVDDIQTTDERGKILILHLYIEEWLEEILKKYVKKSEIKRKLTFWQKAKLVHAVDLIDDLTAHNILLINQFRNLFAHNRRPNEEKKVEIISQFEFRPNSVSKGLSLIEEVCIQTMFDLNETYNYLSKKSS